MFSGENKVSDMPGKEIESTFVIVSEEPENLISKIVNLSALGDYNLISGPSEKIHDIYLDTIDRELGTQKVGFRIREFNGEWKVALKGPGLPLESGVGVVRTEIEDAWEPRILTHIYEEISNRGIDLLQQVADIEFGQPIETLTVLGFRTVQDRNTLRQTMHVVSEGEDQTEVLAELAIDETVYHFSNVNVRHFEVEIEAKQGVGVDVIKDVHETLKSQYGFELLEWDHGKLLTGFAIEKLLSGSSHDVNLRSDGSIDREGYMILDKFFKENPSF